MSRSIDDLYSLFEGFMRSIETDMRLIRESYQEFGKELASIREQFRRHQSDIYRRVGSLETRVSKLENKAK